jgi:hypothetical protein
MSGNYVVPVNNLYVAQYFKSANQTLASGATDITFDLEQPWNNSGSYITHPSGTTNFVVNKTGLYQLEWNATITASNSTDILKQLSIDITRAPIVEQITVAQNASIPNGRNYGQSVSATFYLVAGDVINCRVVNTFQGVTTPSVLGITNTFDLNTWFMWKYIG